MLPRTFNTTGIDRTKGEELKVSGHGFTVRSLGLLSLVDVDAEFAIDSASNPRFPLEEGATWWVPFKSLYIFHANPGINPDGSTTPTPATLFIHSGENYYERGAGNRTRTIAGITPETTDGLADRVMAIEVRRTGSGRDDLVQLRAPNVFKDVESNSSGTGTELDVWTPAAGKRIRIHTLQLFVPGSVIYAAAAEALFVFRQEGTIIHRWPVYIPTAAQAGMLAVLGVDYGPGGRLFGVNDRLRLEVQGAVVAGGHYAVTATGVEES
jgi:hypothetical protein